MQQQNIEAQMVKALGPDEAGRLVAASQAVEQKAPTAEEAAKYRKQLYRYWAKLLRRSVRPKHLTRRGYAMQPASDQDGREAELGRLWSYELTSRERSRRRAMRRQQKVSRRANHAR